MIRLTIFLLLSFSAIRAETYTLTLREAVDLALQQNPELIATRLDEQKAAQSVRLAAAGSHGLMRASLAVHSQRAGGAARC